MKKNYLLLIISLLSCSVSWIGCTKNDPDPIIQQERPFLYGVDGKQNNNGSQIGSGDQEFEIGPGNYTLPKHTYLLKGWVYITNGATLTIPAGTIIKGDKGTKAALIVEPGGKIIAQGTASSPIIFTSAQAPGNRKPGDWGGIILCGNAKNNQTQAQIEGGPRTKYGGSNDDDNSGILSYVRIEFAGYPFAVDKEINGLTMGSVGRGTQIDHIQVSYSNDDSYEWFGGTVACKYLIAYHGWDDDFDTDFGYSGKLQFLLGVRNPKIADASLSNGFESDNDGSGSTREPYTSATFSNVTLVGPIGQDAAFINTLDYINAGNYNPNNGSKSGPFQASVQIRRNSHMNLFNSVNMGYPVGIIIENDKGSLTQTAAASGVLKVRNNIFAQMGIPGTDLNKSFKAVYSTDGTNADENKTPFSVDFFNDPAYKNKYINTIAALKLTQPNSTIAGASWLPLSGSPLLSGASFIDGSLSSGFDNVSFIGAFGSDDWTKGWTNFDPQNAVY